MNGEKNIHWLVQQRTDVPPGDEWLSAGEQQFQTRLRFPKRRNDWRLGRWTAKQLLLNLPQISEHVSHLSEIEILPAADGAPEVFLKFRPQQLSLSISHSEGCGFAAAKWLPGALGCDIEKIAPRTPAFTNDYFTESEKSLVLDTPAGHRAEIITAIWSAKESALKALREGLQLDTRSVEVSFPAPRTGEEWQPLTVTFLPSEKEFPGWWQSRRGFVLTMVWEG